ncbi:hypothetical protein RJT34_23205 [Clitoria ternatea]|uniref:Uncharacterized protein n=1 Tax=Clitoria ternatea TaxID=43366 RepID=A0AAN9FL64_CLITE
MTLAALCDSTIGGKRLNYAALEKALVVVMLSQLPRTRTSTPSKIRTTHTNNATDIHYRAVRKIAWSHYITGIKDPVEKTRAWLFTFGIVEKVC